MGRITELVILLVGIYNINATPINDTTAVMVINNQEPQLEFIPHIDNELQDLRKKRSPQIPYFNTEKDPKIQRLLRNRKKNRKHKLKKQKKTYFQKFLQQVGKTRSQVLQSKRNGIRQERKVKKSGKGRENKKQNVYKTKQLNKKKKNEIIKTEAQKILKRMNNKKTRMNKNESGETENFKNLEQLINKLYQEHMKNKGIAVKE